MTQEEKAYDLEERTFQFAKRAFAYFKNLPNNAVNFEIKRQGIRSSGSIGANFIEANEALSRKDFCMRVKISRKEAKETIYWLRLSESSKKQEAERQVLLQECTELMKIFGSIISKQAAQDR